MPKTAPKKKAKTISIPTKLPSVEARDELIATLQERFESNMHRHKEVQWKSVEKKLKKSSKKLAALYAMEETGGEPDVIAYDKKKKQFTFADCAAESPSGRRSICFDEKARKERKKFPPQASAEGLAKTMGVTLLNEEEYRVLQKMEEFDTKTSSWIATPPAIRKLGGALFADRRYNTIFVYHNGADSYYGARSFRGKLVV